MATLTYPSHHTNTYAYGFDSSRSPSCYLNIDSQSIVKLEPMDQSFEGSMSCRSRPVYQDLSSCKMPNMKQSKALFTETNEDLLSWTAKHPENWSDSEILDWVYYVADAQRFDGAKVPGEAYQNLSGGRLCHMSKDDFLAIDPYFGSTMHSLFRQLFATATFSAPTKPEIFNYDTGYDLPKNRKPSADDAGYNDHRPEASTNSDLLDFSVLIGGHLYDIEVDSPQFDNMFPETEKYLYECSDTGYISGSSDTGYISGDSDQEWHSVTAPNPYDWSSTDDDTNMMPMSSCNKMYHPPKRRVVSGSVSSEEGEYGHFRQERAVRPKVPRAGGSKGNHLWEFVRDLLKDNQVNPSLLKWEDKSTGVFRFVNSEAIAKMWGKKKNNKLMTYEKLSRAMRFCRSAGYFEVIPKNGKFPKKLCFKFGPKAHGWQD